MLTDEVNGIVNENVNKQVSSRDVVTVVPVQQEQAKTIVDDGCKDNANLMDHSEIKVEKGEEMDTLPTKKRKIISDEIFIIDDDDDDEPLVETKSLTSDIEKNNINDHDEIDSINSDVILIDDT